MAFRVEISPEAFGDLDRITSYIQESATTEIAERWLQRIFAEIRSLGEMPNRCAIAQESAEMEAEIRLLLHGKRKRRYKIYFALHQETETVRILHVRHWARKPIETDELADLMDESMDSEIEDDSV